MTVYNPSIRSARLGRTRPLRKNGIIKAQLQETQETLDGLVSFVLSDHLTVGTFRGYARQDRRASVTLDAIGRILEMDLRKITRALFDLLEETSERSLVEFQAGEAPHLFSIIDTIVPDEATVGDGRAAAEKFHYAAEARTALLRHSLSIINQRYPSASFTNLAEAASWTNAFSALIQEASEVITGTQQLLYDEATAIQSYLDTLRNRFLLIEEQARAAAILLRYDWRALLEEAEAQVLDHLAGRHEQLEALTFGELREAQDSGWLTAVAWQTARNAPILGSLLLTIAGGASILADGRTAMPDINLSVPGRGTIDDFAQKVRNFPVLKRHSEAVRPAPFRTAQDEVARFFSQQPRASGRHTLHIPDPNTMSRVLDELAEHGYARRDVLKLLNLDTVNDVVEPIRLDIRWSQGGRPLLLPVYGPASSQNARSATRERDLQGGASLELIANRFGFTVEELLERNETLKNPASSGTGKVVELPPQSWTSQRSGKSEPVLSWGASLEKIARELNVSVTQLTDLNDIANPDTWLFEGQALRVPLAAGATSTEAPGTSNAPVEPGAIRFVGEAKPVTALLVHRVQAGETLTTLSQRYDTTIADLMRANRLSDDLIRSGQQLLVPVEGRVAASTASSTAPMETRVDSGGSLPASKVPAAIIATEQPEARVNQLVQRYGSQLFPTVAEMPPEVQDYFTSTVQEVADFFNVRPGDILGILKAENNNAGFRIHQPAISSAGAKGVAQIIARTWNGWSNPSSDEHLTDLLSIEQHGGIGFDWSMREEWLKWKNGESDGAALQVATADPNRFEDAVSGVARHLVQFGLTRDKVSSKPEWFQQRLADAIAVYNSGRPLSESRDYRQSADNLKTTGEYVKEAIATAKEAPANLKSMPIDQRFKASYIRIMDQTFGVKVTEQEFTAAVDGTTLLARMNSGQLEAEEAARQLLEQTEQHYLAEGRAARRAGEPLPWPYIHNEATLFAQKEAVRYLGRTLTAWELNDVIERAGEDREAIRRAIGTRGDARLYAGATRLFDELLQRSARGEPVQNHEVAGYVQTAMAGFNPIAMSQEDIETVLSRVKKAISHLAEYRDLHVISQFTSAPLSPMPKVIRGYGVPVNYQLSGKHTGIDIANPRVDGEEPPIYAVEDGRVVHVGPLYCDRSDACRGGQSIVIDHGNLVYSIYSHNSVASVKVGDQVTGGMVIGRQGDEGYSFGSHLHFEVHTGAPFTGDWRQPFRGGKFENPMDWLPSDR